jgi:hypothetical protein
MANKEFYGMDPFHIRQQLWDWQRNNNVAIIREHPIEHLCRPMRAPRQGKKTEAENQVSMRIDYEEHPS